MCISTSTEYNHNIESINEGELRHFLRNYMFTICHIYYEVDVRFRCIYNF